MTVLETTPAPTATAAPRPHSTSWGRIATMLGRELRLGPRSPIVLMAIVVPLLMTFVVTAVFGGLLDPQPRLAVAGDPAVEAAAGGIEGIDLTTGITAAEARQAVVDHRVDAALLVEEDFSAVVAAGGSPQVTYLVAGEALADNRAVLSSALTSLFRDLAGEEDAVMVEVVTIGDEGFIPVGDRVLPLLVVYALVVAALFVPAASLLDEREKGTLNALLVTPTSMSEVLIAKAIFAAGLALAMGVLTLTINQAFGEAPLALLLALVVGTAMLVELGLVLGLWAKDMNTLYTWIKAGGILVVLPGLLALFPNLPSWIAQVAPTYYFLQPIYEISLFGAGLGDVIGTLAIAVAICAALLPLVIWSARRTEAVRLSG